MCPSGLLLQRMLLNSCSMCSTWNSLSYLCLGLSFQRLFLANAECDWNTKAGPFEGDKSLLGQVILAQKDSTLALLNFLRNALQRLFFLLPFPLPPSFLPSLSPSQGSALNCSLMLSQPSPASPLPLPLTGILLVSLIHLWSWLVVCLSEDLDKFKEQSHRLSTNTNHSEVTQSCLTLCDPMDRGARLLQLFLTLWTIAYQAPLSMGFSRQEYWSGLPFPSPGNLPNPGIEPRSPAL